MKTTITLRNRQSGAALFIALVLLLVLTLIGVTSMSSTTVQERMAGNLRDKNIAFQAAEAALINAESILETAIIPDFDGTNGLYQAPSPPAAPQWQTVDWSVAAQVHTYTDDAIAHVASAPVYIIEELPPVPPAGGSLAADVAVGDISMYRVTARAVGGTEDAIVILQTTYQR